MEKNKAVKVYAKLPGWFKVPTPLGTYDPDWAVLVEKDGEERLHFVVETKGSLFTDDLRGTEGAKIKCGEAHFEALSVPVGITITLAAPVAPGRMRFSAGTMSPKSVEQTVVRRRSGSDNEKAWSLRNDWE